MEIKKIIETKIILIIVLTLCLLTCLFCMNYLRNEKLYDSIDSTNKYNELLKEKEELKKCFLDRLIQIQTCTLNCYDVECYEERCDIENIYNNLIQECGGVS